MNNKNAHTTKSGTKPSRQTVSGPLWCVVACALLAMTVPGPALAEHCGHSASFEKPSMVRTAIRNREMRTRATGETIVDVAKAAGTFRSLLQAAVAADLANVLASDGPFTVFAPTDDAFAQLPAGTVSKLLKPQNKQQLADILKLHVVAGRVPLAKALEVGKAPTLQGEALPISFTDGRVRVGSAALVSTDIPASNGIIHVIDSVLLPKATSAKVLEPTELIELAIQHGASLFNNGSPAACAAVYEVTAEALRAMDSLSSSSRKDLERTLATMRASRSPRERAWILRHGLDRVKSRQYAGD